MKKEQQQPPKTQAAEIQSALEPAPQIESKEVTVPADVESVETEGTDLDPRSKGPLWTCSNPFRKGWKTYSENLFKNIVSNFKQ